MRLIEIHVPKLLGQPRPPKLGSLLQINLGTFRLELFVSVPLQRAILQCLVLLLTLYRHEQARILAASLELLHLGDALFRLGPFAHNLRNQHLQFDLP